METAPTHRIRVYRNVQEKRHDLRTVLALEDIYGEDRWAAVAVSDAELVTEHGDIALIERPIRLVVGRGVDLAPNYYVELKKPMVLDGAWSAVETTLSSAASTGDTTLSVQRALGFEAGDQVLIKDANAEQLSRLRSAADTALVLYADKPLVHDFEELGTVRASRFFVVVSECQPAGVSFYRAFDAVECRRVVSS